LRILRLPLEIPCGYSGRVALRLISLDIGDAVVASLGAALRTSSAPLCALTFEGDQGLKPSDTSRTICIGKHTDSANIDSSTIEQGEALRVSGCLTALDMSLNRIGDAGAQALGEALRVNGSLTTLDLSYNRIGDAGARALGESLRVNGCLTALDLTSNRIGDAGAQAQGDALRVNGFLTTLDMSYNRIGAAGAQALGDDFGIDLVYTRLRFNGLLQCMDITSFLLLSCNCASWLLCINTVKYSYTATRNTKCCFSMRLRLLYKYMH
jgi:hypothetical protein